METRNHVLALALVFLAISTVCADDDAAEDPSMVRIAVGATPEFSTKVDSIVDTLIKRGHQAEIVQDLPSDPRVYLSNDPDVNHVIAHIRVLDGQWEASVYTYDVPTPNEVRADSQTDLEAKILERLKSGLCVEARYKWWTDRKTLMPETDPERQFHTHLLEGQRILRARPKTEQDIRAAIDHLDEAIAIAEGNANLDVDEAVVHFNLMLAYKLLGLRTERDHHLKAGLEADENNVALRNAAAVLAIEDGDLKKARDKLERLVEEHPNYPTVLFNLGYIYWKTGRSAEAMDKMRRVLDLTADSKIEESAKAQFERLKIEVEQNRVKIREQADEIETKNSWLVTLKLAAWIAVGGLICVAIMGVIVLLTRGTSRRVASAVKLKPEDRLALQVQIGMVVISGLFSVLTVILTRVIGG